MDRQMDRQIDSARRVGGRCGMTDAPRGGMDASVCCQNALSVAFFLLLTDTTGKTRKANAREKINQGWGPQWRTPKKRMSSTTGSTDCSRVTTRKFVFLLFGDSKRETLYLFSLFPSCVHTHPSGHDSHVDGDKCPRERRNVRERSRFHRAVYGDA